MPRVDVVVRTPVSRSTRARQLEGMFDVPSGTEQVREWHADLPIEIDPWSVGLIVGPSGSGKSTVARALFGDAVDRPLSWGAASVIDDFEREHSIESIAAVCQAVGFNTIPAWLRPFAVLSNGEKFRVEMARRLLLPDDVIAVDEFTSVVDRQVAKIGSHAVQKHVRRAGRRFVAVTCHYDVIDWLQPDWVFEPATETFSRRLLQRRPSLDCEIRRCPYGQWAMFAPFHYLTAELHRAARCFVLAVEGRPAAFAGVLNMPHPSPEAQRIRRASRVVVLPDFQGLGLAFALMDRLGAMYVRLGYRFRCYPSHPSFVRSFRSPTWALVKRPGRESGAAGKTGICSSSKQRPCAVFEYRGAKEPDRLLAMRLTEERDLAARRA